MIREWHKIDNELVCYYIKGNNDDYTNQILLDWYRLLGKKDFEQGREKAKKFIQETARRVLKSIDFPEHEIQNLIDVFNPLESILRSAMALHGKEENLLKVRDHLHHTVRNILLCNYLFRYFKPDRRKENSIKDQVTVAAIFHDIAYPVQKLKQTGKNLSDATFKDMLSSTGKVDFILSKPDDLLEIMIFWGKLSVNLEEYFKDKNGKKIFTSSEKNRQEQEQKNTRTKIEHIYKEVIAPAIAGKGLFDAKHYLSSVVLFLRPIILSDLTKSNNYLERNFDTICDICLAIAYHDREMDFENFSKIEYKTEIPLIAKILRIADELQEWDRVRKKYMYLKDEIINTKSTSLIIDIKMKDNKMEDEILKKCKPEKFIPDKIIGLSPIIDSDRVEMNIEFPKDVDFHELKTKITNKEEDYEKYLKGKFSYKKGESRIQLIFNQKKVQLKMNKNNKSNE